MKLNIWLNGIYSFDGRLLLKDRKLVKEMESDIIAIFKYKSFIGCYTKTSVFYDDRIVLKNKVIRNVENGYVLTNIAAINLRTLEEVRIEVNGSFRFQGMDFFHSSDCIYCSNEAIECETKIQNIEKVVAVNDKLIVKSNSYLDVCISSDFKIAVVNRYEFKESCILLKFDDTRFIAVSHNRIWFLDLRNVELEVNELKSGQFKSLCILPSSLMIDSVEYAIESVHQDKSVNLEHTVPKLSLSSSVDSVFQDLCLFQKNYETLLASMTCPTVKTMPEVPSLDTILSTQKTLRERTSSVTYVAALESLGLQAIRLKYEMSKIGKVVIEPNEFQLKCLDHIQSLLKVNAAHYAQIVNSFE